MNFAVYTRKNRPSGTRPTIKDQEQMLKEYTKELGYSIKSKEFQESLFMIMMGKIEVNKINGQAEIRFQ